MLRKQLAVGGLFCVAAAVACAGEAPGPSDGTQADGPGAVVGDRGTAADFRESDAAEASLEGAILPAGEVGARLQVGYWVISEKMVDGFSESGELVAEFAIDVESGLLESVVPLAGFRMLDGSEDHLPVEARAYLDALVADLQDVADAAPTASQQGNASGASELGSLQQALTVACFTTVSGCQAAGVLGLIQGRWRAFTCENRSLFGCRAPFPIALVI